MIPFGREPGQRELRALIEQGQRPKLPTLPYAAYDPPTQAQQPMTPPAPMGEQREIESYTVQLPPPAPDGYQTVYATRRPWTGCDVYVQMNEAYTAAGVLSIGVFAISANGQASLVATGRYVPGQYSTALPMPAWVCGARATSEKLQIVVHWSGVAINPLTSPIGITVVAGNDLADVPPWVGVITLGTTGDGAVGPGQSRQRNPTSWVGGALLPLTVVGVQGSNLGGGTAAAPVPQYLQLFDLLTGGGLLPPNGSIPVAEWALGAIEGDGVTDQNVRLLCKNTVFLLPSSTSGTLTIASGTVQAFVR